MPKGKHLYLNSPAFPYRQFDDPDICQLQPGRWQGRAGNPHDIMIYSISLKA
jgi:hypothetical protein